MKILGKFLQNCRAVCTVLVVVNDSEGGNSVVVASASTSGTSAGKEYKVLLLILFLGAIVGIVLGIILGLLLCIVLAVVLYRRRKHEKEKKKSYVIELHSVDGQKL
jgi:NhaP-type Na+/H+ or K+/H+ antiporter